MNFQKVQDPIDYDMHFSGKKRKDDIHFLIAYLIINIYAKCL